jgi:hydrogenase maturation protein HypF
VRSDLRRRSADDDQGSGAHTVRRIRLRVEGVVQGVGFRAHARHVANTLGLSGYVRNVASHVEAEVEGNSAAVDRFVELLSIDPPPRAAIERIRVDEIAPAGDATFAVSQSREVQSPGPLIPPDTSICRDCRAELLNPSNRRYRYPFTSCTVCGPRFTVADRIPFDRRGSSMASFTMCAACQSEYDDTVGRRFHAQTNACPDCGPRLRLVGSDGHPMPTTPQLDAIATAATAIRAGQIVAIKAFGGFRLVCLANDESAVATLRQRKESLRKPFAVLAVDVAGALRLIDADSATTRLLGEHPCPIVVAPRRKDALLAPSIAPGLMTLGVLLPPSPLHQILVADVGEPLAITSGNRAGEPIILDDADAVSRLGPIADLILLHDLAIRDAIDDSVVHPIAGTDRHRVQIIRRARGVVPATLALPHDTPPLLACGAELEHTFCLASGRRAFVSQPSGDLRRESILDSFRRSARRTQLLFGVTPRVLVHDMDPGYLSTGYARESHEVTAIAVQHHHAHFAACLAEHGIIDSAIGVIYDGPGWGLDGSAWGGEFLVGSIAESRRAGHLRSLGIPGNAAAAPAPWQLACAWLTATAAVIAPVPPALRGAVDPAEWRHIAESSRDDGAIARQTTAMADLLGAMSALTGLVPHAQYPGQAVVEFESAADMWEWSSYTIDVQHNAQGMLILDPRPMVLAVARDAARGWTVGSISARVHSAVAIATFKAVRILAEATGLDTVVLTGSVFQNRRLLADLFQLLAADHLHVILPEALPSNDGGISFGQAAVAAARLARAH